MVGMGSLVTRDVPDHGLVIGQPARLVGYVCACGEPILKFPAGEPPARESASCHHCGRSYAIENGRVLEIAALRSAS